MTKEWNEKSTVRKSFDMIYNVNVSHLYQTASQNIGILPIIEVKLILRWIQTKSKWLNTDG